MSEQLYRKLEHKGGMAYPIGNYPKPSFEPVSLWKWCKDELPEKEGWYLIKDEHDLPAFPAMYRDEKWYSIKGETLIEPDVWLACPKCNLPEPLKPIPDMTPEAEDKIGMTLAKLLTEDFNKKKCNLPEPLEAEKAEEYPFEPDHNHGSEIHQKLQEQALDMSEAMKDEAEYDEPIFTKVVANTFDAMRMTINKLEKRVERLEADGFKKGSK